MENSIDLRPIAILENGLEASLLAEVLTDRGVEFRLELRDKRTDAILGAANRTFEGFARVWAAEADAAAVEETLQEVRDSRPVEGKQYLVNGRMWHIKRS